MNNLETKYITYNQDTLSYEDLSQIFQLYSGGVKAPLTGFKVSGGQDLNEIFDPSGNNIIITYDTGFKVNNVNFSDTDLRYFFAKYNPLQTVTLNIHSFNGLYTSGINGTITWYNFNINNNITSSGIISFISSIGKPNCSINFCIIGGGDTGGESTSSNNNTLHSGGGGGGIYYLTSLNVNTSTNYNIQIGQGGLVSNGTPYRRTQSPASSFFHTYTASAAVQKIEGSGNYTGGNGGTTGNNGDSSSFQTNIGSFLAPNGITYTLGGGGGAWKTFSRVSYGGKAGNGIGGEAGGNSSDNGQNASAYTNNFGGGGGGCDISTVPTIAWRPGNGNPGSLFLWWNTIQ
jgi:hypothetical protein